MRPALLLHLFALNAPNLPPGAQALMLVKEESSQDIHLQSHGLEITDALRDRLNATFGELFAGALGVGEENSDDEDSDADEDDDNREATFEEELEKRIELEEETMPDNNEDEEDSIEAEIPEQPEHAFVEEAPDVPPSNKAAAAPPESSFRPAVGPQETLLTNATLDTYDLAYNTLYKIFVCSPGKCGLGLTIDQTLAHLTSREIHKGLVKAKYGWKEGTVVHSAYMNLSPSLDLETELISSLVRDERSGVKSLEELPRIATMTPAQWKSSDASWLVPGLLGQVKGVRVVYEAYMCGVCFTFCGVTESAVRKHRSTDACGAYQRAPMKKISAVQTILSGRDFARYFRVPDGNLPTLPDPAPSGFADMPEAPTPAFESLAEQLRRRKEAIIGPKLCDKLTKEKATQCNSVLSAFIDTGVTKFLDCFDRSKIRHLAEIPRLDSKLSTYLERLHRLNVYSIDNDVRKAKEAHPAEIAALTDGARAPNSSRPRPFTIPEDVKRYGRTEMQVVSMILRERKKPTRSRLDCEWRQLVYLNRIQEDLASQLERHLTARAFDEQAAGVAYRNFVREIYFPSSTVVKEALQTFTSPIMVFLALQCIGDQNGYSPVWPISTVVAKVQFLMRLRSIHCFMADRGPNDDAMEWFETTVKRFCNQYLSENALTPYATVRHWMHVFTAQILRTPRPYLIQWKSERIVLMHGQEINVDEYFAYVRQKIDDLERFIKKKVLFGISLEELQIDCDPVQLLITSNGGPLLTGDCDIALDNPQSNRFADALFSGSHLAPEGQMECRKGETIQVDPSKGVEWVSHVGSAMQELHPICHVTQGLPGRGTEEASLSQSNIDVELEHHTLGFRPSHLKTNLLKHIFRMLSPRVSKLLYIMIRIVRPVELLILLQHVIRPDHHKRTLQIYRNRVFVAAGRAMASASLSKNLGDWLAGTAESPGPIKFHMGIRPYRHYATALDDKFLGRLEENPLATVGHHQAGRSRVVGEKNYALQRWKTEEGLARAMCVQKSLDWHKMMGI